MAHLLDTSILCRLADSKYPLHTTAARAVLELHRRGEVMYLTSQVFVEFRNVATRPLAGNGFGLSAVDADALAAPFEARFPLLAETPDIYPAWKRLVNALGVVGKQVHDARLVAVCHVHAVTHVLTFNVAHFARLAAIAPGIVVVDPATV